MKLSKKVLVAIVLACIAISSTVTYALISINVPVSNHITILGGTLDLWKKNDDETYTYAYTTEDFDGHMTGDVIKSPLLVLVSDAANTVSFVLNYSDTLPDSVGTILWQVELSFGALGGPYEWKWVNWTRNQINVGYGVDKWLYLPGTPNNPLRPGTKLGLRTSAVPDNSGLTGHFRYTLYVSKTAPCGDYPFDMSILGTEA